MLTSGETKLQKEIDELKKQNKKQQREIGKLDYNNKKEIDELKEENRKLKKQNERFKKNDEGMYRLLQEEKDSHSKTLNNIRETFNFTEHRIKQAELHAGSFNKPESVEGHYRTLIGDWYMMCIKEDNKTLKK